MENENGPPLPFSDDYSNETGNENRTVILKSSKNVSSLNQRQEHEFDRKVFNSHQTLYIRHPSPMPVFLAPLNSHSFPNRVAPVKYVLYSLFEKARVL